MDAVGEDGAEEEKNDVDVDPVQIGDLIYLEDADSFGACKIGAREGPAAHHALPSCRWLHCPHVGGAVVAGPS